ncbi:MAG: phosphomannomutase [Novosphingobium sp. PASSN1]|nr:MAG: phosphomannomutase [Novosphingobium sp. PASSN1]
MIECGVAFGTSGARGEVVAMTDRVCYGYTQGFLTYLAEQGEFGADRRVAIAGDLRPSTPRILAACARAIRDLGGVPVFCGYVPTPALALFSFAEGIPSLMVTGSHIPADRNGIKFYRPTGEVLKVDEAGISRQIVSFPADAFTDAGALAQDEVLPPITDVEAAYAQRYIDHFGSGALTGMRIGVYQHSAVGRDLLAAVLSALGAEITLLGRSETFVPVDTEALRPQDIELAREWTENGEFDAIVSTDGDSDRPLLSDARGSWLRGDVLGILCAAGIGATSVVTPISSNTALEMSGKFLRCRRTRIGSPYVIAAMSEEQLVGSSIVCGYEANGGFLLGTDIAGANGSVTRALPTRDAFLPLLVVLANRDLSIAQQLEKLPQRYTFSDRIAPFPPGMSERLFELLKAGEEEDQLALQTQLFGHFAGEARSIDLTDGVRATFLSGLVVHLRGSGNAPELRCYTEGDTEVIAKEANRLALDQVQSMFSEA